jgi:nucleoporin GLE1
LFSSYIHQDFFAMANSSPSRQPTSHWANGSPQRSVLDELFAEDRNSEARHRYLLELAKREHERVREEAERVYREQLKREEAQRIAEERRKEEERIRLEEQLAAERIRLNELKAKKIAIPPPLPDPEPQAVPAEANGAKTIPPAQTRPDGPSQPNGPTTKPSLPGAGLFGTGPLQPAPAPPAQPLVAKQPPPVAQSQAPPPAPPPSAVPAAPPVAQTALKPNGVTPASESSRSAAQTPAPTGPDRYIEIHKNLKILRKSVLEQAKSNPALKARMGDMRREIRKSVGQLTVASGVAGVNKVQVRRFYLMPGK